MADLTRAEDLVRAMERDDAFRAAVEAAPTVTAKRAVLDARGFQDVSLDDMRAWVEGQGGRLEVQAGGRELTDAELAAVAGGLTDEEALGISIGVGAAVFVVGAAGAAAAAAG